jgi:hypothetical protein
MNAPNPIDQPNHGCSVSFTIRQAKKHCVADDIMTVIRGSKNDDPEFIQAASFVSKEAALTDIEYCVYASEDQYRKNECQRLYSHQWE